jgi:hypothetical protein
MIFLYSFLSVYVLWIFYLAVMNLSRAKENGTITKAALYLGYPVLLIGYLLDILVNFFILTIVFLEIPTGWTVTGRLKDHIYNGTPGSWREKLASWFCANLLNAFDPDGKHC